MSMESAILAHAAALDKLAAAIALAFSGGGIPAALSTIANATPAQIIEAVDGKATGEALVDGKAAELADATKQRAAAARDATAKDAKKNTSTVKLDDDLEKAVAEVEKANAPADLDYNKDVKPVLLDAIRKAGKPTVMGLINSFGVDKADKVPADKLGELLAKAQELAA